MCFKLEQLPLSDAVIFTVLLLYQHHGNVVIIMAISMISETHSLCVGHIKIKLVYVSIARRRFCQQPLTEFVRV